MFSTDLKEKIYTIFTDLLKEKRIEYQTLFVWEKYQKEHPFSTRLYNNPIFWQGARLTKNFETALGTIYQNIAKEIAIDKFGEAHTEYNININLDNRVYDKIDTIVSELREKQDKITKTRKRLPNWEAEIMEIKNIIESIKDVNLITKTIGMDLYIPKFKRVNENNNYPFYAEMKSPMPNLNECERIRRDLLTVKFSDIWKERGGDHIYYAMTYNPYITRENYGWSPVKKMFNIDGTKLLIGKEFWDLIGGEGTYSEILELANLTGTKINI